MKAAFAFASTLVGLAAAQGVTSAIAPEASTPAGCSTTYDGQFEISVVQVTTTSKRDSMPMKKRGECGSDGILVMSIADGVATDAQGRTGYIASNYQFQFDKPAQAGAIYTAGFSVCGNGSLALGGSNVFWECKSGTFYNLYDRNWAEQCEPVEIVALPCGDTDPPLSEVTDGQVVGTTVAQTTIVTTLTDGQPQVITTSVPIPICQINDGQVQGQTTPCASITIVSSTPTTTAVPVSQYSDGQIQVTPPGTIAPAPSTVIPTSAVASSAAPSGTIATASTAASSPAVSAPGTTAAPSTVASVSSAGSTLVTSAVSSASASGTSSSAPSSTSAAASATSSVPASGATRAAGSVGALIVGLLVAFVCL